MKFSHRPQLLSLFFLFTLFSATAEVHLSIPLQVVDSMEQKDAIPQKRNFRYGIYGGPGYSPDYGVMVGGCALANFSTLPSDTTLLTSVLPVSYVLSLKGFKLSLRPQIFFKGDNFRIFGQYIYENNKNHYHGVGYDTNRYVERSELSTKYSSTLIQINPLVLFRVGGSNLFLGPQLDMVFDYMNDPAQGILSDVDYIAQGGDSLGYRSFSSGVGFNINYDTRDMPANAYRGIYLELKANLYNKMFGSERNYYAWSVEYRQYQRLAERRTLAWTVQSKSVMGDVPITRLVSAGSPYDLRGYYLGQYRDNALSLAMLEYRHMINNDGDTWMQRVTRRIGFATWAGVGVMGNHIADVDGVLPNFGLGLRVEVMPRMNFRLDYGYNPINRSGLLYFNMTEAF